MAYHCEKCKEYYKTYYRNNSVRLKLKAKERRKENKKDPLWLEKIKIKNQRWRKKYPNYSTLYTRNRYRNDKDFRLRVIKASAVHGHRRRLWAVGTFTQKEWEYVLWLHNYKCAFCKTTENLSIDHVIPLSRGGSNKWQNLQVLCRSCNIKKGTKILSINIPIYAYKVLE